MQGETYPWGWPGSHLGPVAPGSLAGQSAALPQATAHGSQTPKKKQKKHQATIYRNVTTYIFLRIEKVQDLQKSEKKSQVLWVLDEVVCKLGAQVIHLLLSVLICEDGERLKSGMFQVKQDSTIHRTQKSTQ